ncbi:MAG TPA: type II secretion system F family protein [Chthonomonadaceae bacterium]|nr:type II secretion system F family protein [Chthonomonadaceae bacterium]
MPTFQYTARDRAGQQSDGVIAARDLSEAREILRKKELFLTQIREQAARGQSGAQGGLLRRKRGVKLRDMVIMSRQLATLVRAGISIVECLQAVSAQTQNPALVETINDVRLEVLTGSTLTDAMRKHPKVFSETYISLAQAGEVGGVLEQTLELAADQFDKEAQLRAKVKSAFVYPAIVMGTAVFVVIFMLIFVVPVFANVYRQFNAKLPAVTMMLVSLSYIILHYWWMVLLGLAGLIYALRRYIQTPTGRTQYDRLKLKIPLLGDLNRKIAVSRFTQTFSGAVRSGVPILRGLAIAGQTCGNVIIMEAVKKVAGFVKEGATLSLPLEQTGEFPAMVTRMIAAGEHSGNLDTMLEEITRFYNRDIEYTVENLTKLMEPAMTVIVGGLVLFILLALYMPIFNLGNVIKK